MDNICGVCLQPGELTRRPDLQVPTCLKCIENGTSRAHQNSGFSEMLQSTNSIISNFNNSQTVQPVSVNQSNSRFLTAEEESDQFEECPVCNKQFTRRASYLNHVRNHSAERKHVCQFCQKAFTQAANLRNHERIHTNERPFACSQCGKAFTQITNLNNHIRLHTGERPYQCPVEGCDKAFAQVTNLNNHTNTHHRDKHFKCTLCKKAFTQLAHLNQHSKSHKHHNVREFSCLECPKTFAQQAHLMSHSRVHQKPFECGLCDQKYATESGLRRHVQQHQETKPDPCPMDGCGEVFYSGNLLLKHVESHNNLKKIKRNDVKPMISCYFDSCNDKFVDSEELNDHLTEVHGLSLVHKSKSKRTEIKAETIDISEEEVEEISEQEDNARFHGTDSDGSNKTYECNYCDMNFDIKSELNKHLFINHNRKITCIEPICEMDVDEDSGEGDGLVSDISVREEVQEVDQVDWTDDVATVKVVCTICFNNFSDQESLNRHMMKKHGNISR